jgi:Xaa-Pro aminopeptidase
MEIFMVKEKVNQAKNLLKEYGVDCWITFVRESQLNGDPILPYLVGSDVTWHSAFIITSSGKTAAIVGKYDKKSIEDLGAYDQVMDYVQSVKEQLLDYLKKLNPKQIAINYSKSSEVCDGLTHGMYITLYDYLSGIGYQDRLISAEKIISSIRQRKSKTEIEYMKMAIKHTEDIFDKVKDFIKPGKTEEEIAEFMRQEVKKKGLEVAWEPKMCPSVFTGPDTAAAHYNPTERKVEEGHVLNMDFGVKYNGYCSDLQRTFYILRKGEDVPPPEVMKGFNTIVESIELSRQAMKPGVQGIEIDTINRNYIVSKGYEEFPHALGHQVGRFSHDGTALLAPKWEKYANKPFEPIEEGMIFTIEPRLTVKDYGVATIEEEVLVTATGAEYISTPQKEIILIKP